MYDLTLFKETETKSTTLTLRLTPQQKSVICSLAQQRGTSAARFLLSLVNKEYEYVYNMSNLTQADTHTTPNYPLTDCDLDENDLKPCANTNIKPEDNSGWYGNF